MAQSLTDPALAPIAALLDHEPAAIAWASSIARTMGWAPFRARLERWQVPPPGADLPWRADVASRLATLPAEDATLLAALADCDASVAWDVLEAVVPEVSVDAVCRLADAGLLVQHVRADVVTFAAPFTVRAVVRTGATTARWLDAWTERTRALPTYGPRAAATLVELAAAVPLAARALRQPETAERGLALWLAAADAIFFAGAAVELDDPAFGIAVTLADADDDAAARTKARLIAARAGLERGDAEQAIRLVDEAGALAPDDELRADAHRGRGWAAIAATDLDAARATFEAARAIGPHDPRNQADASAGLGILALLTGDPAAARTRLDEALAIHVVMRDAPREAALRGMMELLPAAHDDSTADAGAVLEHRARGQHWREALALARLAIAARTRGDTDEAQKHLLEASAAALVSRMPAVELVRGLVEARRADRPIVVGPEGRTLALPSGETHDLARHGPVRRVLWALAVARRDRPGLAMSTLDVVEVGWPGEKMKHDAANLRVYTTVRRLRGLGLSEALVTRDDGYLLDPSVLVVLASSNCQPLSAASARAPAHG